MTTCPVCGGDRDKPVPRWVLELVKGSMHDPGGIELRFDAGRKLRITGECNACDLKTIEAFIATGEGAK